MCCVCLGQVDCDCVCAMLSRVQVVGTAFNRNLGGRNFDDLLVKKLVEVRFASCACPSLAFVLNSLTGVCVELIVLCRNSRSSSRLTVPPRRRRCSASARLPPRPGRASAVSSAQPSTHNSIQCNVPIMWRENNWHGNRRSQDDDVA